MAAGDKSLKNPLNTSSVTSNSSEASTSAAARPLSCTTRSSSTWPSLTRTRCIFRTVTANSSHATRVASSASRAFSTSNFILRSSCSSCIRTEATPEVERTGLRDPARADIIDTSLDSSCSSWRAMTRQSRSATPRCSTGRRMRCRATLWSPSLPGLNTWRSAHNTAWRVFFDVMSSGTHNRTAKSWCMQLSRIASTQGSAPSSCNKLGSGASPSLAKASAPGLHGINTSRTTSSAVMSAVARRGSPQLAVHGASQEERPIRAQPLGAPDRAAESAAQSEARERSGRALGIEWQWPTSPEAVRAAAAHLAARDAAFGPAVRSAAAPAQESAAAVERCRMTFGRAARDRTIREHIA
eukprot:scaffold14707_cov129-Isochrysis_galbana.AAC.14